ncbi:MAG: phosphoribosylglycinamide formyltransferase [Gammaproteobacteria bacterium]|nr:phosphoribosylglycinamide formyltransferase [Gammaproteobacteria bacterium]
MASEPCRVVVLISGTGSNLLALIRASNQPGCGFSVKAAISNNPQAPGLDRANQVGIATAVVNHRGFETRQDFERVLQSTVDAYEPDLVLLAGFMRILGADFVSHYLGHMLNIHPSLLPKFTGLNTHQRVLEAGEREHGASVHFVTRELDGGPIIAQDTVPVFENDTAAVLAARVLEREHRLYPMVVTWFAAGRLQLRDNRAVLDNQVLPPGGMPVESVLEL